MGQNNRSIGKKGIRPSDLPPTDYENLDDSIRARLIVEIFHNMGCMSNKVYFTKYDTNAEALDRDYSIWKSREYKKRRTGNDPKTHPICDNGSSKKGSKLPQEPL